ncbi:MAG TPA: hypothetical protein VK956_19790, partial [Verrucomicrobium sp.]|nr:hypothetical protein [Verrucomicrobium sp.]
EVNWPEITDCDRLDEAFAELETRHIISLQNAGYTQSDGMEDVSSAWHERGHRSSGVVGYCFYHGQDLERAVMGEGLYLAFGDINGDDSKGEAVGETICSVLTKHRFKVEWDHTVKTRILVPVLDWKRRAEG